MDQNRAYRRTGHVRSNGSKADRSACREEDDLFVFGYHCTIFRDDQKAEHVDFGRHLIPLTFDPSTTIDSIYVYTFYDSNFNPCWNNVKQYFISTGFLVTILLNNSTYDCRLLLNNVPEISISPISLSLEEQEMEYLCDEERYKDLREIGSASTSAGAAIPYDYGATTVNQDNYTINNAENSTSSDDDELFAPSSMLKVPADMITPSSFVQNTVIEKTAVFVAQKGPQMEIIVNAKQKSNKRFRFLDFDNPLNKYYKHVLKMVREKKYTPVFDNLPPKKEKKKIAVVVKRENPSDESDDEGGDYMHPSFFSTSKTTSTVTAAEPPKPEITLPIIDYKIGQEKDVYSALYNRLSAFIPKREEKESAPDA
uniref:SURP motif domain-containing protein n=1 Tax=Romanomermis culicivorax TaxID=13658 RepID=A0A915IDL4_ROMCU